MKKFKKFIYLILSLISAIFATLRLYYMFNNFFNKNIGRLDSDLNFINQLIGKEPILGYKTFGSLFTLYFTLFLICNIIEKLKESVKINNKIKATEETEESLFTKILKNIIEVVIYTTIVSLLFLPNFMQDIGNSSVITYISLILLSLMIIGEVFKAVDNTFELGYVEKITNMRDSGLGIKN